MISCGAPLMMGLFDSHPSKSAQRHFVDRGTVKPGRGRQSKYINPDDDVNCFLSSS